MERRVSNETMERAAVCLVAASLALWNLQADAFSVPSLFAGRIGPLLASSTPHTASSRRAAAEGVRSLRATLSPTKVGDEGGSIEGFEPIPWMTRIVGEKEVRLARFLPREVKPFFIVCSGKLPISR